MGSRIVQTTAERSSSQFITDIQCRDKQRDKDMETGGIFSVLSKRYPMDCSADNSHPPPYPAPFPAEVPPHHTYSRSRTHDARGCGVCFRPDAVPSPAHEHGRHTEDGIRKVPAASSCSICFFRFVASSFVGKLSHLSQLLPCSSS